MEREGRRGRGGVGVRASGAGYRGWREMNIAKSNKKAGGISPFLKSAKI